MRDSDGLDEESPTTRFAYAGDFLVTKLKFYLNNTACNHSDKLFFPSLM